jgi:hypothetical protein
MAHVWTWMRFVWIMMLGLPGIAAGEAVAPAFDDARDILERNCVECHTQEKAKADLIMTTREAMVTGGESGTSLKPGDPAARKSSSA